MATIRASRVMVVKLAHTFSARTALSCGASLPDQGCASKLWVLKKTATGQATTCTHRRARMALSVASITSALVCSAPLASAGVPLPRVPCSSTSDCDGCGICVAGNCELPIAPPCRCDAECEQYGYGSCELSHPDEPVCGGACSMFKPTGALTCGEASDAWVLGMQPAPIGSVTTVAVVSPQQLEVAISSWSPVANLDVAESGRSLGGCSVAYTRANALWLGPALLLQLALLWRRR